MAAIPKHVAIIPDGNRRWAKDKGLVKTAGHVKAGAYENIRTLLQEAKRLGVKYVSFWGFSTENWNREKKEVDAIVDVIAKGCDQLLKNIHEEKVGFRWVGRRDRVPKSLKEKFERLEKESEKYKEHFVLFCIDYGGRDEIVRAVNKVVESGEKIDETCFVKFLDTSGIPDPELIIRTGGERRLSGFMPFQSTYAELYFTDIYFPDFDGKELRKAIGWFSNIDRRFGG